MGLSRPCVECGREFYPKTTREKLFRVRCDDCRKVVKPHEPR